MTPEQLRSLSARFAVAEPLDVALWREAVDRLHHAYHEANHKLLSLVEEYEDPNLLFPVAMSWLGSALIVYASDIGADGLPMVKIVTDTSSTPVVEYTGIARTLINALAAATCAVMAEILEQADA